MSQWLDWARQPFQPAAEGQREEKAEQQQSTACLAQPSGSGKEEKEEKANSTASTSSASSSWLPSLPSLSLPSFLSSTPASTHCDPPPPASLPSISSSPSTNVTSTLVQPPPADVSYLRSLLSSFTSAASPSSQPTSGVTPSGLRWKKVDGVQGFALSMPADDESREQAAQYVISEEELAHVKQICQQLTQQQQHAPSGAASSSSRQPAAPAAPTDSSSSRSTSRSPSTAAELHTHTRGAVVVNNTDEAATAASTEREVAVLDLDTVDWWTLVDPARDKEAAAEYNIEEGYVVVRHEDTVDAMAVYLAQVLVNHPHASQLSARELANVIDRSLRPLDTRRGWLSGRYVTYGYYAYLAYSWSATAYSLYRRPWMIKLVATGAVQAASWLLVLFV